MSKLLAIAITLLTLIISGALPTGAAAAPAPESPDRDPRNWPTVTRFKMDRYELAGRVITLRVHAKRSDYFNCRYTHSSGELMAFTLLGGPYETLTGYMPKELGRVLEGVLAEDPWAPITVRVRYDPERLSDVCADQVDVLMWSRGWQYPPGSITPGRPDPTLQPTAKALDSFDQDMLWAALKGRERLHGREIKPLKAGDKLELTAGARPSFAYYCVFRSAARTHYALRLHNGSGDFVHGYLPRTDEARRLLDYAALHRDVLVTVQAKVVEQPMSHYCGTQLEITGWSLPDRTPEAKEK